MFDITIYLIMFVASRYFSPHTHSLTNLLINETSL